MTDRELLDLAAKAAGMNLVDEWEWSSDPFFEGFVKEDCCPESAPHYWNPLTDDGDALRLAGALEFGIFTNITRGVSWVCNKTGDNIAEALHDDAVNFDPYAATRRAIVYAAAQIGKESRK